MPIPLIVGLAAALVMIVAGGARFWTNKDSPILRNPDGSMYGGFVRVTLGVGILWFLIGAGLSWLIMWIF